MNQSVKISSFTLGWPSDSLYGQIKIAHKLKRRKTTRYDANVIKIRTVYNTHKKICRLIFLFSSTNFTKISSNLLLNYLIKSHK